MTNYIITGETGSGKTYHVINNMNKNKKFIYIAPCRQLVYESFIEYSNINDSLITGEIHDIKNGSIYAVYESISLDNDYSEFDSLIIDEAHFLSDFERGGHLYDLINKFRKIKNIYLVTATDSIDRRYFKDFENIHLTSKFKVPAKKEVEYSVFKENMLEHKLKTIMFCTSINGSFEYAECLCKMGINAVAINSTVSPAERLKYQYGFKNGDIQVVCSTNVLAQGLNFPAENIYIPEDMWDTDEMIIQKLGRLGRPFSSKSDTVFYHIDYLKIPKKLKKKKPTNVKKTFESFYFPMFRDNEHIILNHNNNYIEIFDNYIIKSSFKNHELINLDYVSCCNYESCYNSIKYSKKFITFLYDLLKYNKINKNSKLLDYVNIILYAKESIDYNERELKKIIDILRLNRIELEK